MGTKNATIHKLQIPFSLSHSSKKKEKKKEKKTIYKQNILSNLILSLNFYINKLFSTILLNRLKDLNG